MSRRGHIMIVGAGNVGSSLAHALRRKSWPVRLVSARRLLERAPAPCRRVPWMVVLAVRDGDIATWAERLVAWGWVGPTSVVVHVAGRLGAEVLAPVRSRCAGVAQMHPLISFAARTWVPTLRGGHVQLAGDPHALQRCRRVARHLGMRPRSQPGLDLTTYHTAAALVANGTAALAQAGAEVLVRAGAEPHATASMLGALLTSVAANISALGLPRALTGPVRRGDATAIAHHLATLELLGPQIAALYRTLALAQIPMATVLGDASLAALDEIERQLRE